MNVKFSVCKCLPSFEPYSAIVMPAPSAICRRLLLILILLGATASTRGQTPSTNEIAERYVRLVLALGQHDPDYVDAYYGPAEWKTAAEKEKKPLPEIRDEAAKLSRALAQVSQPKDEIDFSATRAKVVILEFLRCEQATCARAGGRGR